ncbi:MAG: tRNA 2-thiouridine(34) synthase MnmA [Pseudomonadales bacterium]
MAAPTQVSLSSMNNPSKVIVGMSGGVDSSVTALLLQQQGYAVEGLFMKNWDEDDGSEYCTAKTDLADAQAVADKLGIHLHTANFAAEYWDNVFEYFLAEYRAGRTPNPDILCNREIKFKVFLDYATILGADKIATGHYCRVKTVDGKTALLKGLDPEKDQSYFLHAVTEQALAKTLFPIGELEKSTVRQLAEQHGLATAKKKDSTGICFIGERRFKDFLERYLPAQPGDILTVDGKNHWQTQRLDVLHHRSAPRLGHRRCKRCQRRTWACGGQGSRQQCFIGSGAPLTVCLCTKCSQLHWISGAAPSNPTTLHCKIRYRQADQACKIAVLDNGNARVDFAEAQRAISPGQSIVFYQGDVCLGGGIIEQKLSSEVA